MAMIATPAIVSSVSRWSVSVWPRPVAVMPSRMKMAENVSTNSPARESTFRSWAPSESRSSSGLRPQTVER